MQTKLPTSDGSGIIRTFWTVSEYDFYELRMYGVLGKFACMRLGEQDRHMTSRELYKADSP
jgi:hypothetical protein